MNHDGSDLQEKAAQLSVSQFPHPLPAAGTGKPLYLCVYDAIYSTLKQGEEMVPAGTSLPSESEFTRYWKVSKGTVREALYHLLEDGVVQKSQGKRAVVSQTAHLENFTYQMLSNPVRTFCNEEYDRTEVEYRSVSNSDWLSEKLKLSEGTVLVKGTLHYFAKGENLATTVFFTSFSLLEKEEVKVSSNENLIRFIETQVYEKAEYGQSAICLIDEMVDNELPKMALPLLLVEEFLYTGDQCFMFLRHYLNKDAFRIQTLRKKS